MTLSLYKIVKQEGKTSIMAVEQGPLAAKVRRDGEANRLMKTHAEAYWKNLGHDVKFYVAFNEKLNIHELRSDDLKNGLPFRERLTEHTRRKCTRVYGK